MGPFLKGRPLGYSEGDSRWEVVFNTAMTGYQEILTDPSYRGQMVVDDLSPNRELWHRILTMSNQPDVCGHEGFIVREESAEIPSNWRISTDR